MYTILCRELYATDVNQDLDIELTQANQSQSEHLTKVISACYSALAFSVCKCLLKTFVLIRHNITTS